MALNVFLQFFLKRQNVGLKCLRDCFVDRAARIQQLQKLAQLRQPLAVVAEDQVMHQRPRFSIEHAALAAFVVLGRVVIDREQRAQWIEFALAQGHQVIRNQFAQMNFAAFFD